MRVLDDYKKELTLKSFNNGKVVKKGKKGVDAKKIQEWLFLNSKIYSNLKSIEIDSDFGNATEKCVKNFQNFRNIKANGIVDESTFFELTKPLRNAFTPEKIPHNSFRELICKVAQLHLENTPEELSDNSGGNLGPWVRSYCEGNDGDKYYWCMGFVQNIFDISCDLFGNNFKDFIGRTTSRCNTLAKFAIKQDRLIRNNDLENRIDEIGSGDLFLKYSPDEGFEWHHIGIITKVFSNGVIETIEGNVSTNKIGGIDDTSNGTSAFAKCRNLFDKKEIEKKNGESYLDYYEVYKIPD